MNDYQSMNFNDIDIDSSYTGDNGFNYSDIDINVMQENENIGMNQEMSMGGGCPITEPLKEKCVHRTIMHEVPHVCPIRTRIINHHVYRHTYRPSYSCCEENVVSNVQCGSCSQFQ